jgi:hypothetical protein
VRYLRAFVLICFSLGLFVQVAAQASATPQVQTASAMDCSEMAHSGHGDMKMQPADEGGPCDMTLECLVAMNCIPPIALAGPAPAGAPIAAPGTPYQPDGIVRLKGSPIPPESPPPQLTLTV